MLCAGVLTHVDITESRMLLLPFTLVLAVPEDMQYVFKRIARDACEHWMPDEAPGQEHRVHYADVGQAQICSTSELGSLYGIANEGLWSTGRWDVKGRSQNWRCVFNEDISVAKASTPAGMPLEFCVLPRIYLQQNQAFANLSRATFFDDTQREQLFQEKCSYLLQTESHEPVDALMLETSCALRHLYEQPVASFTLWEP